MAYIDLNPVAAGVAATPEMSPLTSVKSRVDHVAAQGKLETRRNGSRDASKLNVENGHWLFPIEDRRDQNRKRLAGPIQGVSLSGYLQLVNWSSRLIRPGKVSLPDTVPDILTNLQTDAADWKATLEKFLGSAKTIGSDFGNHSRLREVADRRRCRCLRNIMGNKTTLASLNAN